MLISIPIVCAFAFLFSFSFCCPFAGLIKVTICSAALNFDYFHRAVIQHEYSFLLWQVDGRVIPGPLFDFGLHMFHNSEVMMKDRNGPFFYLPKVQYVF